MPEQTLNLDESLQAVLDEVRDQQGLESRAQAAEWLARRRIRKGTQGLTGRGRAIYEVNPPGGGRR